jgi:hypothetical protein
MAALSSKLFKENHFRFGAAGSTVFVGDRILLGDTISDVLLADVKLLWESSLFKGGGYPERRRREQTETCLSSLQLEVTSDSKRCNPTAISDPNQSTG